MDRGKNNLLGEVWRTKIGRRIDLARHRQRTASIPQKTGFSPVGHARGTFLTSQAYSLEKILKTAGGGEEKREEEEEGRIDKKSGVWAWVG